ncbi:DUF559 domain-containing protein [Sanguibacter sp. A247]|uniref:DUF559 domain-containing protein n=1 Tax=unclassified Sanguibacter TaxID=2645534 RepID=UPI003FD84946
MTGRVFTRAQAADAGASRGQVRRRVASGTWIHVAGAAYRHRDDPVNGAMLVGAALLTWPHGIVVGPAAAAFHGAPIPLPKVIDVAGGVPTTRTFRGLRPRFIDVPPDEVLRTSSWSVVSARRAYVQALAELPRRDSENLWAWVTTRNGLSLEGLREDVETHPGRHGNRRLKEILAWGATGAVSEAERRAHGLLIDAGIAGWEAGVRIDDAQGVIGVVDLFFAEVRLVIEIDGVAVHQHTIVADSRRRNRLVGAGCTVLTFTWDDLVNRPARFVGQVRKELVRLRAARR